MEYIEWDLFVWAIGIFITIFTMTVGYLIKRIGEVDSECKIDRKEADQRLDNLERCFSNNEISLAKISKDIEYIKIKQDEITLRIKELVCKDFK